MSAEYCNTMCETCDRELDRLQELYETAGDPTLSNDAWLSLVEVANSWTEYVSARARLYRDVCRRARWCRTGGTGTGSWGEWS